ncbi:MAG: AIR carboxylase family protein [Bacteroidetes bacterium]|nr:AIR carboxylase family protein [Bacteroidota bacterium]MCL1968487.1 AIR carboxylase family protein [Bacteroidota bacterium]
MNEYTKTTALVAKGKTKEIWGTDNSNVVIMKNLSNITADNDPKKTREFETKAISATTTTCRVFELLEQAGIPTAYIKQLSETEIIAKSCNMIPLEVIARRYAVGSYLKRHPELKKEEGILPHRFHRLCFELFLKTTGGGLTIDGETLIAGLTPDEDDPFIGNPYDAQWMLLHPKTTDKTPLGYVDSRKVLPQHIEIKQIEELTRKTFLVLEGAWNNLGYRLIDFKLEFGMTNAGELVIADVIDNDSWRLRTPDWEELSKQVFREGHPLNEVENKYARVAQLVSLFHIPMQTIVCWRGSENDKLPEISNIAGLTIEQPVISAHKKPTFAMEELERLHTVYPEGGVIIALVGMSNGLGPILSARTDWPVISVCTTANEHPEDVWSNLRMPSDVPNLTVLSPKNALLSALDILGQKNPVIYAYRRLAIEALDK